MGTVPITPNPQRFRNRYGLNPGTAAELVAEHGKVHLKSKKRAQNPEDDWLQTAIGAVMGRSTTAKLVKVTPGCEPLPQRFPEVEADQAGRLTSTAS